MRASWTPQDHLAPALSAGTPGVPSPTPRKAQSRSPFGYLPWRSPLAALPSASVSLSPPAFTLPRLLPVGLFISPLPPSLLWSKRERAKRSFCLPGVGLLSPRSVLCPLPPIAIVPRSEECAAQTCECPSFCLRPRRAADRGGGVPAGRTYWLGGPWGSPAARSSPPGVPSSQPRVSESG